MKTTLARQAFPIRTPVYRLLALCGLCALALAACGGGEAELHRGYFSYGFETVSFRPCGSDDQWWVTGDSEALNDLTDRYAQLTGDSYQEVYVELRGRPSAVGSYGHLGAYQRELALSEVVDLQATAPEDCN